MYFYIFITCFVCLFDLILYVPSTIFQLNRNGSSWVEPVLSKDKCILLKDNYLLILVIKLIWAANGCLSPLFLKSGISSSRSLSNHGDIISDHKWSCLTKPHLLLIGMHAPPPKA